MDYEELSETARHAIMMTPKCLYEWAVANGVENCQMYFPADEFSCDVYLTMNDMCKETFHDYRHDKERTVVNICR